MWNACTSESGSEMFTAQQLRALTYVSNQVRETGVAPSFDEIREHLGLKSKSGVHRLLTALEERGAIRRLPNRARAVEIRRLPESLANTDRPVPAAAMAGVRDVPLMGRIAAGTPIAAIQVTGRSIGVPDGVLAGGEHFALEVKGDSMTGAGILDGDVVVLVVDRTDHSLDSSFNGFNTWFQRTRLVLGLCVNESKAKQCFNSSSLHELQILQPLFLLLCLKFSHNVINQQRLGFTIKFVNPNLLHMHDN